MVIALCSSCGRKLRGERQDCPRCGSSSTVPVGVAYARSGLVLLSLSVVTMSAVVGGLLLLLI